MSSIINRNQRYQELNKKKTVDINNAVDAVNEILSKAVEFPVHIPAMRLGSTRTLRYATEQQLTVAGWTFRLIAGPNEGDAYYEVS